MKHLRPITPVRASLWEAYTGFFDDVSRAFAQFFADKKAQTSS